MGGAEGQSEPQASFDVAVVGGGAAGVYAALCAAELGASVCLISRKPLDQAASYWAQGGLAAAIGPGDDPSQHAAETITAGRDACRPSAAEVLASEAPGVVEDLQRRGVAFDTDPTGALALGLEGGHGRRRVVHAGGSATGRRITRQLDALAAAEPRIDLREQASAVALWSDGRRCCGVLTDGGPIRSRTTVLATGGGAALWRRTSNPRGAIGAGLVLAHAAGADLADLEFCQFHPTALRAPGRPQDGFLVTEAIRGEGATLHGADGERFVDELAPRDEVTEAIIDQAQRDGRDHVSLDMRRVAAAGFPNVVEALRSAGIDPESERVPVAPAAHYLIGGIATDLDGRASVEGLFAVGECSCNGLHGANRLASNSLTECFVFGRRAARTCLDAPEPPRDVPFPEWRFDPPSDSTREAVWELAGPRRDASDLERLTGEPFVLARLIARSALAREESRGAHRRRDHPGTDPALDEVHFVLGADGELRTERWTQAPGSVSSPKSA